MQSTQKLHNVPNVSELIYNKNVPKVSFCQKSTFGENFNNKLSFAMISFGLNKFKIYFILTRSFKISAVYIGFVDVF